MIESEIVHRRLGCKRRAVRNDDIVFDRNIGNRRIGEEKSRGIHRILRVTIVDRIIVNGDILDGSLIERTGPGWKADSNVESVVDDIVVDIDVLKRSGLLRVENDTHGAAIAYVIVDTNVVLVASISVDINAFERQIMGNVHDDAAVIRSVFYVEAFAGLGPSLGIENRVITDFEIARRIHRKTLLRPGGPSVFDLIVSDHHRVRVPRTNARACGLICVVVINYYVRRPILCEDPHLRFRTRNVLDRESTHSNVVALNLNEPDKPRAIRWPRQCNTGSVNDRGLSRERS